MFRRLEIREGGEMFKVKKTSFCVEKKAYRQYEKWLKKVTLNIFDQIHKAIYKYKRHKKAKND